MAQVSRRLDAELVVIYIDGLHEHIQIVLKVPLKQLLQGVFIRFILKHLLLHCHPTLGKIEMLFLQIKLQHLECLHQERVNAVSPLSVCLST